MKVTLLSSEATMFDQDSGEDGMVALLHQQAPPHPSAPLPLPIRPSAAPLPGDSLLWNATHGEESGHRRSVCHTCLKEREGEGERMTGEVAHPPKTITGQPFNVCLRGSDTFPDYSFKLIRLTRTELSSEKLFRLALRPWSQGNRWLWQGGRRAAISNSERNHF